MAVCMLLVLAGTKVWKFGVVLLAISVLVFSTTSTVYYFDVRFDVEKKHGLEWYVIINRLVLKMRCYSQ